MYLSPILLQTKKKEEKEFQIQHPSLKIRIRDYDCDCNIWNEYKIYLSTLVTLYRKSNKFFHGKLLHLFVNFTLKISRISKIVGRDAARIGSNYFRILISKIYDFPPEPSQGGTKLGIEAVKESKWDGSGADRIINFIGIERRIAVSSRI